MSLEFEANVRDLSHKGLGVVDHPNGKVYFVEGVWPGDIAVFKIISEKKNFGFAKLVQLKKESFFRVSARCPHQGFESGKCGGCSWMIADYLAQVHYKQKRVMQQLSRAGLLDNNVVVNPMIHSEQKTGYRNRAQFKTDGSVLGYVSSDNQSIAKINDCLILTKKNRDTLTKLLKKLPNKKWKAIHKENWSTLDIDEDINVNQVLVNKRSSFQQANYRQNQNMKRWVYEKLSKLDKKQSVTELFSGSGNFTQEISKLDFKSVIALEGSKVCVDKLNKKSLKNVTSHCIDINNEKRWSKIENLDGTGILFLDPPREGFEQIDSFVAKQKSLSTIIYISCNLDTFCKDVKSICGNDKWKLSEVQPIDMFPQTPHVELMSVIVK